MSVIGSNALAGASGQGGGDFLIEKSLRFTSGDSAYLDRTPSSASNRKTWTLSFWVKNLGQGTRNRFHFVYGSGNENTYLDCTVNATGSFQLSSWGNYFIDTTAKFRDPSAWYHFVVQFDTTNSTAADRRKLWVNGVEVATNGSAPTLNGDYGFNNNTKISIGSALTSGGSANNFSDCYLAEYHFIDGQALDATSFGAFDDNGVWQAAEYTGSYGTNGFHLDFADGSNIGNDAAGSNNWTANNLTTTGTSSALDLLFDSPANGDPANDTEAGGVLSGNYCTWNPLSIWNGGGTMLLEDGNLNFGDQGQASKYGSIAGTIAVNSGKWFFEVTYGSGTGVDTNSYFGIIPVELLATLNSAAYFNVDGCLALRGPHAFKKGATQSDNYASGFAIGDTISVAFDCDNGTSTWYKNGTSLGTFPHTFDTQYSWTPFASDWSNGQPVSEYILNCGQRPFSMTPPTGYKAICTANLPTPDIADGSTAFDVVTYTSDGTSRTISGLNMSPDLVWSKRRSASARHVMSDSVRGVNKELFPNLTNVERTSTDGLTSFNSDGYTLGDDAGQYGWQSNGNTFVNWAWDAGSSTVSNTDGSITSSVRANQTAGFSIVSYTGTGANGTIGHGLNSKPAFAIFKTTTQNNWGVYHESLGATNIIFLNLTNATSAHSSYFQDTEPTSSIFTIGADGSINTSGATMISYMFSPVQGYSAFGKYTTGGANEPFLYLGFRPRFILYRYSNTTGSWAIWDTERSPYNVADKYLLANASDAEATLAAWDIVSNGLKPQTALPAGNTLIYAAFAENPFQANGGLAR